MPLLTYVACASQFVSAQRCENKRQMSFWTKPNQLAKFNGQIEQFASWWTKVNMQSKFKDYRCILLKKII